MSDSCAKGTAVVMAGGRGVRMRPLTDLVPKPLLPVGAKPILEILICKLRDEGFGKIVITTGYKGEMIESYFGDGSKFGIKITYTREAKPLGTVGALTLIPHQDIEKPFLVINGDLLVEQNLADFMIAHVDSGALVSVGIRKHMETIRFGVIDRDGSLLREIEEKPQLYFDIGAGIYAISPTVISRIPSNTFLDFPALISKITQEEKVNCIDICGMWKDIGRSDDYEEVNSNMELLKFLNCEETLASDNVFPATLKIPMTKPNLGYEEAQACFNVVISTWVNEGKKVAEFEDEIKAYIGCKHAVAFFNGTVALHALLVALDIGPADEVIVPSFTFASTATTVLHAGGVPVFADIDPDTFTLDPNDVESRITEHTVAIIVVHYAGQSADMDSLQAIAKKYGLFLIEDAAEALGAEYNSRKVGSIGAAGMFSFTPTKNITTGEGGVIVTDDKDLAWKLRLLKNHGSPEPYHHLFAGYNYRMTEMQGAIGVEQMKKLASILRRKIEKANYLTQQFRQVPGIIPPVQGKGNNHTYMMYTVKLDPRECLMGRDELMEGLAMRGIQTKVYFPPLHKEPVFSGNYYPSRHLPVTEKVADTVLSLPIYASLDFEEIDYIVNSIRSVIEEYSAI